MKFLATFSPGPVAETLDNIWETPGWGQDSTFSLDRVNLFGTSDISPDRMHVAGGCRLQLKNRLASFGGDQGGKSGPVWRKTSGWLAASWSGESLVCCQVCDPLRSSLFRPLPLCGPTVALTTAFFCQGWGAKLRLNPPTSLQLDCCTSDHSTLVSPLDQCIP